MHWRTFLTVLFLLTIFVVPPGLIGILYAQTEPPKNLPAPDTGEIKTGTITNKNSRAYKRMQMMIEQAEWARIRAEKIRAGNQGNAETPK